MPLVDNFVRNNFKLVLIDVNGLAICLKTPLAVVATRDVRGSAIIRNVQRSVEKTASRAWNPATGRAFTWVNVKCLVEHCATDFPVTSVVLRFLSVGIAALLCAAKHVQRANFVRHVGQ